MENDKRNLISFLTGDKFKIFGIFGFLIAVLVGVTVAYYNSAKEFENVFSVKSPGVAVEEKFNPSDHWLPGEEKQKEVIFKNTGKMDMLLRFSVDIEWDDSAMEKDSEGNIIEVKNKDGKRLVNGRTAESVITLYWNSGQKDEDENDIRISDDTKICDFTKEIQNGETYYYYNKVLKAGEKTNKVLESVKFMADLSNDGHKNSDFSNKQINVSVKAETVLADEKASDAEWNIYAEIDGSNVIWTTK